MDMKYVMFEGGSKFLIFPAGMTHSESIPPGYTVKSAGFVHIVPDHIKGHGVTAKCFGKSESLGVASRPKHDSLMITITLNQ